MSLFIDLIKLKIGSIFMIPNGIFNIPSKYCFDFTLESSFLFLTSFSLIIAFSLILSLHFINAILFS